MFSLFTTKFTKDEKTYLTHIEAVLSATGLGPAEAASSARQILDAAVKKAVKAGLRGVKNLGDKAIKDDNFTRGRISAGLSKDDIMSHLNRDYVLVVAESTMTDAHRFSIFKTLTEEGQSPEAAVRFLRKSFISYGNPADSHKDYQGADADIYPEFAQRFERWRSAVPPTEESDLASQYSTYNAMIRDLVGKGIV